MKIQEKRKILRDLVRRINGSQKWWKVIRSDSISFYVNLFAFLSYYKQTIKVVIFFISLCFNFKNIWTRFWNPLVFTYVKISNLLLLIKWFSKITFWNLSVKRLASEIRFLTLGSEKQDPHSFKLIRWWG